MLAELLSEIQQGRLRTRVPWRFRSKTQIFAGLAMAGVMAAIVWGTLARLESPNATSPTDRARPSAPVHSGDSHTDDVYHVFPQLLSIGPGGESEFAAETTEIDADLDRLESYTAAGDAFLQSTGSPWQSDLESARRRLLRLENSPYPDAVLQGDNR
jgi:hypothetical protein